MDKAIKSMTPKEGLQIGRNGKTFKHGDIVPEKLVEELDPKYLEEFKFPEMTIKKGMSFKVEQTKYEPGTPIADEDLIHVNPLFTEPFVQSDTEAKTKEYPPLDND